MNIDKEYLKKPQIDNMEFLLRNPNLREYKQFSIEQFNECNIESSHNNKCLPEINHQPISYGLLVDKFKSAFRKEKDLTSSVNETDNPFDYFENRLQKPNKQDSFIKDNIQITNDNYIHKINRRKIEDFLDNIEQNDNILSEAKQKTQRTILNKSNEIENNIENLKQRWKGEYHAILEYYNENLPTNLKLFH